MINAITLILRDSREGANYHEKTKIQKKTCQMDFNVSQTIKLPFEAKY